MFKILIADDEGAETRLLEGILQNYFGSGNIQIYTVSNGKEAVDTALLWNADIALLDIEMPVLDGLAAARQILQKKPKCRIIFVTAYSLFTYAHEALKMKVSDFILKPVSVQEVTAAVKRAMEQIELERQLEGMSTETLEEGKEGQNKANQLIEKVKDYLKSNYTAYDLSLDSVSEILKINPTYLSSLFKKCTGTNFIDYVTDLKINAAKELLKDPLRPASEIASETGFESASYFTRAFKKKTGITPTEYRKSLIAMDREEKLS